MSITIELPETASRARAYAALLGTVIPELDAKTLGACVESWARFVAAAGIDEAACVATLRHFRDTIPVVSLAAACLTLDIDIRDVINDD
jgi:hypothetical protein